MSSQPFGVIHDSPGSESCWMSVSRLGDIGRSCALHRFFGVFRSSNQKGGLWPAMKIPPFLPHAAGIDSS